MVSIDINLSLWLQIANFLVLLVALNFILYRPIRGILRERAEKKAQMSNDISASEEGTASQRALLESQRAQARKEGSVTRDEITGQGHTQERQIIDAATKEMEAAVEKVRDQIRQDIGQARDELQGQVRSFGVELAQKILGRSIQ